MTTDWIDVSIGVRSGMVAWPGDPEVVLERFLSMDTGDDHNVSRIAACVHVGTHVDAPLHFVRGGHGVDQLPLDLLMGEARVIEITNPVEIGPAEIERAAIHAGERLLFKTRNSNEDWTSRPFKEDFVHVSRAGAERLAEIGVKTVGVDYLSVAGYGRDEKETHLALLSAGVCVIEGLFFGNVRAGKYELICLPIKLVGSDGAPARTLLRPVV